MPAAGQDLVVIGTQTVQPGETALVPVFVVDVAGTALGGDQASDLNVQGLSVGVRPSSGLAQIAGFTAAGALESLTPQVETTVASGGTTSWIAAYDPVLNPVSLTLGDASLIGVLSVPISGTAAPGTTIDLQLSPAFTALSNTGGTVMLNGSNGGLQLTNGSVVVESPPLFADDFETGDVSAWSNSVP